jgi:hypothetical protein
MRLLIEQSSIGKAFRDEVLPGVSISQVEVRRNLLLVAVCHRGGKALSEGTIPVLNACDCDQILARERYDAATQS